MAPAVAEKPKPGGKSGDRRASYSEVSRSAIRDYLRAARNLNLR
jgi:hypothetical protein